MVFLSIFMVTYEVAKFYMIKLYLDAGDAIHANKHTKYANCGSPVKVWIIMLFCFMMKKDHFKQKLLLWSQVPFRKVHSIISCGNYFIT